MTDKDSKQDIYVKTPANKVMLDDWHKLVKEVKDLQHKFEEHKYISAKEYEENYLDIIFQKPPEFRNMQERREYFDKVEIARKFMLRNIGNYADWSVYIMENGERKVIRTFKKQFNTSTLYHNDDDANEKVVRSKNKQDVAIRNGNPFNIERAIDNLGKAVTQSITGGIEFSNSFEEISTNPELRNRVIENITKRADENDVAKSLAKEFASSKKPVTGNQDVEERLLIVDED